MIKIFIYFWTYEEVEMNVNISDRREEQQNGIMRKFSTWFLLDLRQRKAIGAKLDSNTHFLLMLDAHEIRNFPECYLPL